MFQKAVWICAIALVFVGFPSTSDAQSFHAFSGAADRSGDRAGPLEMANDFTVNSSTGINVTQLGIFVDGFDGFTGLSETHVVSLYDRSSPSSALASITIGGSFDSHDGPFAYNNPQNSNSASPQLQGGWIYLNISQLLLPNGFQGSIVAYKMSDGSSNTDDYGEAVPFNTGGGLISFTHSFFSATTATSGDPITNSSTEHYGAGSFTFAAAPAVPEPGSLAFLGAASVFTLFRRRRHV